MEELEILKNAIHCMKVGADMAVCEDCNLYECDHTDVSDLARVAIKALEKQIPMEHHHTIVGECSGGEKVRNSICPNCLGCIMTVAEEFPRFCVWCGQAIDWEK